MPGTARRRINPWPRPMQEMPQRRLPLNGFIQGARRYGAMQAAGTAARTASFFPQNARRRQGLNLLRRFNPRQRETRMGFLGAAGQWVSSITGGLLDPLGLANKPFARAFGRREKKGAYGAQQLAEEWKDKKQAEVDYSKDIDNPNEFIQSQELKAMHGELVKAYASERKINRDINADLRGMQEKIAEAFQREPMLGMMLGNQGIQLLTQFYALMRAGNLRSNKELESFMHQTGIRLGASKGKMIISVRGIPLQMESIYGAGRINFMTEYLQGIEGIEKKRHMAFEAGAKSESVQLKH